jgi:hypothetical protein
MAFSAFSRRLSITQAFDIAVRSIALFVARRASSSMRPRTKPSGYSYGRGAV